MQTIGKYVFLPRILTPFHIQPLSHKYSDTGPSPFLSLSRRMLRKATKDAFHALCGGKDQNARSPAPRAEQQSAERKGAEPGARGAWEGSDRTKDGHRAGKRIPSARDSSRTITRFQRPLQDPPASCHHGPNSSCLSCSPVPRPRELLRAEGDLPVAEVAPLSPPPKATRDPCGPAAPPQSRPSPPGASGTEPEAKLSCKSVQDRQRTLGCRGYCTIQAWHCGVKGKARVAICEHRSLGRNTFLVF